jgi:SAM domain (Sterile alpha motif)
MVLVVSASPLPCGGGVDIDTWLRELGLERYEQAFRDNDVDAKVLRQLTAGDLKDIGITSVGRLRRVRGAQDRK